MSDLDNKELFLRKIKEHSEKIEADAKNLGVDENFIHISIIGVIDDEEAEEGFVNLKAYFVFNVFDENELESVLNRAMEVYMEGKDNGLDFDDLFKGSGISLN